MSDVEEEFEELTDDVLDADEESEELGEDEEMEDLDDDDELDELDDETRNELKVVDEVLSQKELNARSLAVRRALELRMDEKRMHDDLDYLDD